MVRRQGDWSLIRKHIDEVIAGGNAEFAEYVIRWIAWSIQNPAAQAEVALVLIGYKGTGKGTLARLLRRIFGAHAFQVMSREHVIGRFNGHLEDCVLFIADEAYWGGDKRPVGTLQGMITEETLAIENKGYTLITVPNYLHVMILAEPGWVIPAGRYERRYAAFSLNDAMRGKHEYFKALHDQIERGGAEAMMWDMWEMDLGDWHPREIPESLLKGTALQHQQSLTLHPLEQWYLSILEEGEIPGALITDMLSDKRSRPRHVYAHSLLAHARNFHTRLRYELTYNQIQMFLEDQGWPKATKWRDKHGNGYIFFPLQESRQAWDERYSPRKWNNMKDWRDLLPGETVRDRLSRQRLFEIS